MGGFEFPSILPLAALVTRSPGRPYGRNTIIKSETVGTASGCLPSDLPHCALASYKDALGRDQKICVKISKSKNTDPTSRADCSSGFIGSHPVKNSGSEDLRVKNISSLFFISSKLYLHPRAKVTKKYASESSDRTNEN